MKKAFDSLPIHVIIKHLIDLRCSWNIVHSISALLDSPVGRLRGSTEGFIMERGAPRKLVLDEIYNLATQISITLVAKNGDEWKLGHIEYADDLCLMANTITEAEGFLQRLDTVLAKFHMEIATDRIHPAQHYCPRSDSWPQLQEDTQGRGAGEESSTEMPSSYNTAKAPEPMDWAEQTKTGTYEETTRQLPERTSRQKEGTHKVLQPSASS
ncbi:hypothetical protein ACTXT7_005456 [Hymenolepis weldensis]